MKKLLLLSFLFLTMCTLTAQITYQDFGAGWEIPINANMEIDVDNDGTVDFLVNGYTDELGLVPVFLKGCFTSPDATAYNNIGSRELQLHEQDELILISNSNMFDYIDDDRGSSYSLTGGTADGWVDKEDVIVGFAVFNSSNAVRNGWMTVSINLDHNTFIIKEWAYTDWGATDTNGILAGDRGETSVKTLNTIEEMSITPNPADQFTQLDFEYTGSEALTVVVQNAVGKELYRSGSNIPVGNTTINLQTAEWTGGVYFVRFETDTAIRTERLVISR